VKYGTFLTNLIDFVIVAFAVFIVIKMINRMKQKQEAAAPAPAPGPSATEQLLMEIRDSLKK